MNTRAPIYAFSIGARIGSLLLFYSYGGWKLCFAAFLSLLAMGIDAQLWDERKDEHECDEQK